MGYCRQLLTSLSLAVKCWIESTLSTAQSDARSTVIVDMLNVRDGDVDDVPMQVARVSFAALTLLDAIFDVPLDHTVMLRQTTLAYQSMVRYTCLA